MWPATSPVLCQGYTPHEEAPVSIPEPREMDIVYATDPVNQRLHRRLRTGEFRARTLPVNHKDFSGLDLCHNFDRMRCDDDLSEPILHEPNHKTLQIWVHIDVRFIKYNRGMSGSAGKKPDRLQPHLKAVAHAR